MQSFRQNNVITLRQETARYGSFKRTVESIYMYKN